MGGTGAQARLSEKAFGAHVNIERAARAIEALAARGVREFVLCAGARNSPLVEVLGAASGVKTFRFFEERSAAFFALGRIKELRQRGVDAPVAVVTTSGTAAAELLPAAIEAHYTRLPLVLLTADRPRRYRGCGAPQSIEQVGLFSHYTDAVLDIDGDEPIELKAWEGTHCLHLNVCFDEPLIDAPVPGMKLTASALAAKVPPRSNEGAMALSDFFKRVSRPAVVVGALPTHLVQSVSGFLRRERLPIVAEGLSQLRGRSDLSEQILNCGEASLRRAVESGEVNGILRVGGVPTLRLWRDLEDRLKSLPVLSLSDAPFTGLSRGDTKVFSLGSTLAQLEPTAVKSESLALELSRADRTQWSKMLQLFSEFQCAEPSLVRKLSTRIPAGARVFIGNSLPIREWDLAADETGKGFVLEGNRGANGIDGQLSTFFGFAGESTSNWVVVGDLTALYDLAAPWALRERPLRSANIVVINNGGGRIFSRMFRNPQFENRHQLNFSQWAAMWGFDYRRIERPDQLADLADSVQLIELVPDNAESDAFAAAVERLWR